MTIYRARRLTVRCVHCGANLWWRDDLGYCHRVDRVVRVECWGPGTEHPLERSTVAEPVEAAGADPRKKGS